MIPGGALKMWLADRQAQARTYEQVEEAGRRWREQPATVALERELATASDRSPEALLEAARRFIDRTDEIDGVMRELIAASRADPFFRPPFHPLGSEIHTSLLLFHHADLSISVGVTGIEMLAAKKTGRKGSGSINFTGFLTMLRFVKAGGATLSFWEALEIGEDFVAEEAGHCRLAERRQIEDGEEIVIDGKRQSFVIEHAQSDILFFQAVARTGCAPLGAEYDSESLSFVGASSTDEASSRLQMMVSLLRAMDCEEAFPLLEAALESPHFYTRWHVMREMLAMDADAALPALCRLGESDPHPDVRAAARQAITHFFPGGPAASQTEGTSCPA